MICGIDFVTARILCRHCGWQRVIGYTGQKDTRRAVIRIKRCENDSVLLSARSRIMPCSASPEEITALYPEYRDLEAEAFAQGHISVMNEFQPLLNERVCPRCHKGERLSLDSVHRLGAPIRY